MFDELNVMTDTRYGKMLYNSNDTFIGKSLEEYGEWAQLEMEFLTPYIPLGGICVDIGAYIGTHTLFFADAVGPTGIVVAFEAQQPMFQILCANVALNHLLNIRAFNVAVDETSGVAQINHMDYMQPNHFGAVSISRFDGYPVESRTLDECSLPSLDFLKIDVEGFEAEVLSGAMQTIQTHQPFIYAEYDAINQSQDLVELMHSMDYDVYEYNSAAFNPKNFKRSRKDIFNGYTEPHIFCVPKSKGLEIDMPLMPE